MSIPQVRSAERVGGWRAAALAAMAIVTLGARTAQAEFCKDLDIIVSSAAAGFSGVRGERISTYVDSTSDNRVVWECLQGLPGVDRCEVEWLRQTYTYNVQWLRPTSEAHAEAFAALRQLLAGCGTSEREVSKSGKSIWLVVAGQENLDLVLAYNSNRVRLSLSVVGFPNPDLE